MFATVCPVCNNKFYCENNYFEGNSALHRHCIRRKKSKDTQKNNPVRTSTPVPDFENTPVSSFSDSVTDFFYQSWKNGLHSSDNFVSQMPFIQENYNFQTLVQPMCYSPQVVYINTVIYQGFPTYMPQVGYRSDGTFGLLPTYWNNQKN